MPSRYMKMLNMSDNEGSANQSHYITSLQIEWLLPKNKSVGEDMEKRKLTHCQREYKLVYLLWKAV
jgi:hypothetical protein